MNNVASFDAVDRPPADGLASWYMPGLTDGFGDRLLMFDNTASNALELLRFHAPLAATPGFEELLHEDVRRLRRLTHAAFPTIRGVERLESDGALVLVSTHTPGTRLSAFLGERPPGKRLHPAFVMSVVNQIIQPISMLQAASDGFVHGALTADRIILAPDGRVRVVEHVLGSALRHLARSPDRLWQDFGLLVPNDDGRATRVDARGDVFQLGVLALSMLLARRVTPGDVEQLPHVLDQWSRTITAAGSQPFGDPLRLWLERALQVGQRPYRSAAEAHADLRQLPSVSTSRAFAFLQAPDVSREATPLRIPESAVPASKQEAPMANPLSLNDVQASEPIQLMAATPVSMPQRSAWRNPVGPEPAAAPADQSAPATRRGALASKWFRHRFSMAAGLTAVALVQGVVIAMLLVRKPAEPVSGTVSTATLAPAIPVRQIDVRQAPPAVSDPPAGLAATAVAVSAQQSVAPVAVALNAGSQDVISVAIAQAAAKQRSGGVTLSAPIELKVLQGDRVLGSSADGPIVTTAGTHELDLINPSLGFRTRRTVTFRAGEITTVNIAVPPGRISVNAAPWAEVWIDSRRMGETPLANLEIPIGEHEVVFRNPDFGERRQNVVVRADAVTRVSTTFDR